MCWKGRQRENKKMKALVFNGPRRAPPPGFATPERNPLYKILNRNPFFAVLERNPLYDVLKKDCFYGLLERDPSNEYWRGITFMKY